MSNYTTTVEEAEKRWGKNMWDVDYPTFPRVVSGIRKAYYKSLLKAGMSPDRAKDEAGRTVLYVPRR